MPDSDDQEPGFEREEDEELEDPLEPGRNWESKARDYLTDTLKNEHTYGAILAAGTLGAYSTGEMNSIVEETATAFDSADPAAGAAYRAAFPALSAAFNYGIAYTAAKGVKETLYGEE